MTDPELEREIEELLKLDPEELRKTCSPMMIDLLEVRRQKQYVQGFMNRVADSLAFTMSLPYWVRRAMEMGGYNPEFVAHILREHLQAGDYERQNVHPLLTTLAVHRIHRFGAGPAPSQLHMASGMLRYWLEKGATPEQREIMGPFFDGLLSETPLEPQYNPDWPYHPRGDWPIIVADASFYRE